MAPRSRISVIVPTYQEGETIGPVLETVMRDHQPDELIVVDGGSTDGTVAAAQRHATVIRAPKGRARQLNAGARAARGAILLFLHADTRLPFRGLELVREAVDQRGAQGGRFRMRFEPPHPGLALYEWTSRWPAFSTGDQAFFVSRAVCEALGGFREDIALEDVDFFRRLRRQARVVIVDQPVVTSSRRFVRQGILRQVVLNTVIVALAALGWNVAPLMRRWYPDVR